MDVRAYNREKWDKQVENGNPWTIPSNPERIAAARKGEWSISLTEQKSVPRDWFPQDLHGVDILCLASGGGQQGPVLAAAGANVTVFDNSPRQLEQDRMVAQREGLIVITVEGDMRDLNRLHRWQLRPDLSSGVERLLPGSAPGVEGSVPHIATGRVLLAGFDEPKHVYLRFPTCGEGNFRGQI